MGGGPPAGAQRVDVPYDNSVLLMPTAIRTAAVTRWVGRGNGPSRVTGANACPAFFLGSMYIDRGPLNETRPSSSVDAEPPRTLAQQPETATRTITHTEHSVQRE
jgi:hypothetical protein